MKLMELTGNNGGYDLAGPFEWKRGLWTGWDNLQRERTSFKFNIALHLWVNNRDVKTM